MNECPRCVSVQAPPIQYPCSGICMCCFLHLCVLKCTKDIRCLQILPFAQLIFHVNGLSRWRVVIDVCFKPEACVCLLILAVISDMWSSGFENVSPSSSFRSWPSNIILIDCDKESDRKDSRLCLIHKCWEDIQSHTFTSGSGTAIK